MSAQRELEWVSDIVCNWISNIADAECLRGWITRCRLRLRVIVSPPPDDLSYGATLVYRGVTYRVDEINAQRALNGTPRDLVVTLVHEDDWVPF